MNEGLLKTRPMVSYDCEGEYCQKPVDALSGSAYYRDGKFYCGACFKKLPDHMKYPDYCPAPMQKELAGTGNI
jgi:hypothetical protein